MTESGVRKVPVWRPNEAADSSILKGSNEQGI